ncbi:uncharacterized protein G2W53_003906 [Senna tora]|uniref:Uncharacterized protein n=1 Tax=Senna tora TaxID=362788 RepID=A0A834XC13_9FABA|nr:uncharacterized protein G2W53_003906 [Senna tora]
MARPLVSQYLNMLGILLSGTLSLIQNYVRGHMPFLGFKIYIFPNSDQLGEVLEGNNKHQFVTVIFDRSQKLKAYFLLSHGGLNVYRDLLPSLSILTKQFPSFSTHLLYRFTSEFYLAMLKLFQECLDHIMPKPQAFFTKAYVPLECKPRELARNAQE